jgi:hypothetical protein
MHKRKRKGNLHAKERALERYEITLTKRDILNIIQLIQAGKSLDQFKLSNARSLHLIDYNNERLPVIYNKVTKRLVTVLKISHYEDLKLDIERIRECENEY